MRPFTPIHLFDRDTDRCICGAEEVFFEDGETGYGCEVEGLPWHVHQGVSRSACRTCHDE